MENMKVMAKAGEETEVKVSFLKQEWEGVGSWIPSTLWVQAPWFGPVNMTTIYQEVPGISVRTLEDLGICKTHNCHPPPLGYLSYKVKLSPIVAEL